MPPADDRRDDAAPPPAPRGSSPTKPQRPSWRPRPRWVAFFLGLLALNLFFSARAMQEKSRVRVPYSPYFLSQIKADHVEQITSKGTAIQGEFKQPRTYQGSKPTKEFRTEVPAFANTDELSKLLQEHDVTVNAQPLDTGGPWWQALLLGFGPTILLVGLLVWLSRRAGKGSGFRWRACQGCIDRRGDAAARECVAGYLLHRRRSLPARRRVDDEQ